MPLFGGHKEEPRHEPEPAVEEKSSLFHRNRTGSISAPSERSMSTTSSSPTTTTPSKHTSFLHKNRAADEDPVLAEAEQRLIAAEQAERDADIALINARERVKGARLNLQKLREDLMNQAKSLKARQEAADHLGKRAKLLGRHA